MKKSVLMLTVFCTIIFTSACGGLIKYDKITSDDFFSGMECDISLENLYSFAPYDHYSTDDSFEDIRLKLEEKQNDMSNFTVEHLTGNSLLIQLFEDEKSALFVLKEYQSKYYEANLKYHYWFSDFSMHLYTSDETKEAYGIAIMDGIPLPHHLLGEEIFGSFSENNEIPIIGGIDEFEAFYQTFQKVYPDYPIEVEHSENQLKLRNVPVKYDYQFYDDIMHYQSKTMEQIVITFLENNNQQPVITLSCMTN